MNIFTNSHAIMAIFYYIVFLLLFLNNRNMRLKSNQIFHAIIHITNITLTLDVIIFYILRKDTNLITAFDTFLVRIFVIILVWGIYMHLRYVKNVCSRHTKHCIKIDLPLQIIATVIMAFGSLGWEDLGNDINIVGVCVTTAYTVSAIQILFGFINSRLAWKYLDKKERFSLRLGAVIWVICLATQLLLDYYLDTLCVVYVMTMFIYFYHFESTSLITDNHTELFNVTGFLKYTEEQLRYNRKIKVVNIHFGGLNYVRNQFGNQQADAILSELGGIIENYTNRPSFYINSSNLISIIDTEKQDIVIRQLQANLGNDFHVQNTSIQSEITYLIMDPSYVNNIDEFHDILNYVTEEASKNLYCEPVLELGGELIDKLRRVQTIITILQNAILNDGFNILYQPIYNTKTHTFSSSEALIRIKDTDTLGFISPEEFIPIAEKYGLISQIGYIVFNKVCSFAKEEKLWEKGVDYIEINLSAIQSIDTRLPEQLHDILEFYNIKPSFINLEITETAAVNSEKQLSENMTELKKLGCTFSMDDFGTGYSNLSQIAQMGYDIIKLDKSLIWPCFGAYANQKSIVILENIVNMILNLGIHIVAEGIETKEQVQFLENIGVHYLQGYYFSRPITESQYLMYLDDNN